jgi:hypothetical protein
MDKSAKIKKNLIFLLALTLPVLLGGCTTPPTGQNRYQSGKDQDLAVDPKYSLSEDREKLNELRKDIPEDQRHKNDSEALILNLMNDLRREPSDIRRVFDDMVAKKRSLLDKDLGRERDQFTEGERKEREKLLEKLEKERNVYNQSKHTRDERSDFSRDQDAERKNYFSQSREKREDFEAQIRERRKNFDDRIRARQLEFNQELRAFSRRRLDKEKEKEKSEAH